MYEYDIREIFMDNDTNQQKSDKILELFENVKTK